MSQRLIKMRHIWCLLLLNPGPLWNSVKGVTVRTPPKNPATIEAQAKFFQDFFSVQLSPYKIEFGHVCEDPNTWEQRYEKKDYKNHRDMGKVRWGDKNGGYGEHYWDLNHAGHAGNHGDNGYESDDGSYHDNDNQDPYDEPSEQTHVYDEEYDPENASKYDESGRAKRAHPRANIGRKQGEESLEEYKPNKPRRKSRRNKETLQAAPTDNVELSEEVKKEQTKTIRGEEQYTEEEEYQPTKEKNQLVLVVEERNNETPKQFKSTRRQPESTQYVPYEGGAGVRQHQHPEVTAASVPRLFLEPTSGHVIDRATGQAYVLQPIIANNNKYH